MHADGQEGNHEEDCMFGLSGSGGTMNWRTAMNDRADWLFPWADVAPKEEQQSSVTDTWLNSENYWLRVLHDVSEVV